jgi:4-azaleucine resistance transporter AzlC
MTALFVCVFVDQWLKEKRHAPALIGVLASVGALLIFGKDAFLIPAMAVIITLLCVFRGKIEEVAK